MEQHIKKIYNQIIYDLRNHTPAIYEIIYEKYSYHWRAACLKTGTLQQLINQAITAWNSYYELIDAYTGQQAMSVCSRPDLPITISNEANSNQTENSYPERHKVKVDNTGVLKAETIPSNSSFIPIDNNTETTKDRILRNQNLQNPHAKVRLLDSTRHSPPLSKPPGPPGYKQKAGPQPITFIRRDIQIQDNTLIITLPDCPSQPVRQQMIVIPLSSIFGIGDRNRLTQLTVLQSLVQIRFIRTHIDKNWRLLLIYRKPTPSPEKIWKNVMAIDLGLNNICAISLRYGQTSYLVNGRPLKSRNQYYNYRIAECQRIEMNRTGSSNRYSDTAQIRQLRFRQSNYSHNYLHKVSKIVIDVARNHRAKIIVIGSLTGIKQHNTKRSFVQVPYLKLIANIEYKARLNGIRVIFIDESYTSKCSAFDLEPISRQYANPARRIHRGMFVTESGIQVNSDINGSLNILRKFLTAVYAKRLLTLQSGQYADMAGSIPELIVSVKDKGFVMSPIKIDIHKSIIIPCDKVNT